MELQTVVELDGRLVLPAEIQQELGIEPGSTVQVKVSGDGLQIVQQQKSNLSESEGRDLIRSMQELFKDADYSLEDDLIQMRKEEAEHSLRKYGC